MEILSTQLQGPNYIQILLITFTVADISLQHDQFPIIILDLDCRIYPYLVIHSFNSSICSPALLSEREVHVPCALQLAESRQTLVKSSYCLPRLSTYSRR
jgi:hypothetical protein